MLICSLITVLFAHVIRIYRWTLFVDNYEKPPVNTMTKALSVGYIINFFVPFKLGDLVRAYVAGGKMKNGRGFALATVIVERFLDVIVVGVLFGFFYFLDFTSAESKHSLLMYAILAVCVIVIGLLAWICKKQIKRLVKAFASIFNEDIEERVLVFSWALVWGFKDILHLISRWKLILSTVIMWGLYITSYWCFGLFLGQNDWKEVFISLFSAQALFTHQIGNGLIWRSIYLLVPSAIILLISYLIPNGKEFINESEYINLIPHVNVEDRRNFLELYFSANNPNFVKNYLAINRKVYVLRDYSAGSNATTILCNAGEDNFYRKYALGDEGDKLFEQIEWIEKYRNLIPLPDILQVEKTDDFCFYDMAFNSDAYGLFDFVHSAPREKAWSIIRNVLECLGKNLYCVDRKKSDERTILKYVSYKVSANLIKVYEASQIRPLIKYDELIINGVSYHNLPYYEKYLNEEYLTEVFKNDYYTAIHGDLTLENIICVKRNNGDEDFYIIDPNTGNIHNSPFLDYAKMLQSIHGNYEFLMATKKIIVSENYINFKFIKSDAYEYLMKKMDAYLNEKFSYEEVKSIYFHEVVHWLRLMPYKINKNGKRAVLFYAGLLMVLDDVVKRYGD